MEESHPIKGKGFLQQRGKGDLRLGQEKQSSLFSGR